MNSLIASTFLGLYPDQLWIIFIGILACSSAGFIGCFLILRKLSLMGDAISHAVLPGIAISAMITGSVSSLPVLLGAGSVGVLTPFLIDLLKKTGRIYEDASIGVVFTALFSLGVILVSRAGNVDLDIECVLFGEIANAPLDVWNITNTISIGPRSFWILAIVFLLNILFVGLFYKELKLSTFDESLAQSMGLRPRLLHYSLLGLVALTTIATFESVGAIIVVAMLIAPGATAYLLTDRLHVMLGLSILIGALCAILGYTLAMAVGGKVSISGCMATTAGLLFTLSLLFSPHYGAIPRGWRRLKLSRRLGKEHVLSSLYKEHEKGHEWVEGSSVFHHHFDAHSQATKAARKLLRQGMLLWEDKRMRLTPTGMKQAEALVRAHRLWEAYLQQTLGLPPDHVHRSADDMEHFLSPELQEKIASTLQHPHKDPHGKPIPSTPSKPQR